MRSTVKVLALDGKTGYGLNALRCGTGEYDNTCFGVFRDLSGSIALQRNFSTASLAVLTRSDVWSGNQNSRLRGWEMIEWE
jgi:hypothetical protein